MPKQTVKVLRVDTPGNSLSTWLAAHHPDLFVTLFKQAQAAQLAAKAQLNGLRGLADGTTTFDQADTFNPGASLGVSPGLQTITIDPIEPLPFNLVTDATPSGSSWLSNIGSGLTSAGSSIADVTGSVGSSIFSALGSVGNFLTSSQGLTALTGLTQTYFGAQAANSNAQTQAAVLQAQAQRAAAGQTAAPIRYTTDAAGNLVPVYATQTPQGAVYQPLSSQGIANLTPSSVTVFLSRYGLWLGLGALALWGVSAMIRR